MNNKKGWLKIIEAFIAILIVIGVILLALNKSDFLKEDISSKIYDTQLSILREVEQNTNLRQSIVGYSGSLPINWEDFQSKGFGNLEDKIKDRTPNYLICESKICSVNGDCLFSKFNGKNIYAQSIRVFTTNTIYSPKQLKLFCWVK